MKGFVVIGIISTCINKFSEDDRIKHNVATESNTQQTDEDQNENPEDQFYLEESFGNLGPHVDIVILIVATSLVCFVVKDKRDNAADEDDDQAIQTGVNQEKHGSSQ